MILAIAASIVVIVVDDVGEYDLADVATPSLDTFAAQSARFPQAWTTSSFCSPSRVSITGLYPHRVGIGFIVKPTDPQDLDPATDTLADQLREEGYATCMVGKWHLTSWNHNILQGPGLFGFDAWRSATAGNLQGSRLNGTGTGNYYDWGRIDDGVLSLTTEYTTTAQTNAAIEWWNQTEGEKFLWLSYNAAHDPFHVPPTSLTGGVVPVATNREKFEASIMALDKEIGRFLASAEGVEEAYVFFWSDNGTPANAFEFPPQVPGKLKGSMFEGGVATPLFVRGPGVEPKPHRQIVSTIDIYTTALDLIGADGLANDSLSFAHLLGGTSSTPARQYAYADRFGPNFNPAVGPNYKARERMATDGAWKLIVHEKKGLETFRALFDLRNDPNETMKAVDPVKEAELQAVLDAIDA